MKRYVLVASIFGLLSGFCTWAAPSSVRRECKVTALDVGQGDAILIQTVDHQDILIDGGPGQQVLSALSQALPPGDNDIEFMILTHPHADHVNGLVSVTERYRIKHVAETGVMFSQTAYAAWHQRLQDDHVPRTYVRAGDVLRVGAATLSVFWPAVDERRVAIDNDHAAEGGGVNDSSIVLQLLCGESRAWLMGDASADIESRILATGVDVRAGLLKVGHHGSRFSSSRAWLEAVQPEWAIISVGAGNTYHHPHPTTLERLQQLKIMVQRTDMSGSITFTSNRKGGWDEGS